MDCCPVCGATNRKWGAIDGAPDGSDVACEDLGLVCCDADAYGREISLCSFIVEVCDNLVNVYFSDSDIGKIWISPGQCHSLHLKHHRNLSTHTTKIDGYVNKSSVVLYNVEYCVSMSYLNDWGTHEVV